MRLLNRKKEADAEASELPSKVLAALDEAVMHQRHSGDDARVIVQLPGKNGFLAGSESCAVAVKKLWPDLNEKQVEIAVKRLVKDVRKYINDISRIKNWASRW